MIATSILHHFALAILVLLLLTSFAVWGWRSKGKRRWAVGVPATLLALGALALVFFFVWAIAIGWG